MFAGTSPMALLSNRQDRDPGAAGAGADFLMIGGERYGNSAAKFWSSLIDEICEDFPHCSSAELSAPVPGLLNRGHLFPEGALQNDLGRLLTADFEAEMESALAEISLLGPPSSIRVRLLDDEGEVFSGEIPADCADADILPFFVTWLLEWAEVPESAWNDSEVAGCVKAEDIKRAVSYSIPFTLTNRHLSEGLWQRTIVWRMAE